jgi:signal peptidase I
MRHANATRGNPFALVKEVLRSALVSLCLFALVRFFLLEAFTIPSGSMERTLLIGDFLLVNKMVYGAEIPVLGGRLPGVRRPVVGDVIVFQWPEDQQQSFVKRIVAANGDTVEMRDGVVYRNGIAQPERYAIHEPGAGDPMYDRFSWQQNYLSDTALRRNYHPSRNNWGPLIVPKDSYFVLGDNRDNSLDSRFWGFVADSLVRGKPLVVYFSVAPDKTGVATWIHRMRWRRLGTMVE